MLATYRQVLFLQYEIDLLWLETNFTANRANGRIMYEKIQKNSAEGMYSFADSKKLLITFKRNKYSSQT